MRKKIQKSKYQRIILKISGEILGNHNKILDQASFAYITKQIVAAHSVGTKIGVVIGGGNIIRGRDVAWFDKVDADFCGMFATMINGVVIQSQLKKQRVESGLSSGIEVSGVIRQCNKFEDQKFYEAGGVVIFVGGTGNPLFTTDTAAALRAVEFGADVLIKGTKVEGVYSGDPKKDPKAKFFKELTFGEAIERNLQVMDLAAFNICRETNTPIHVYNFMKYNLIDIIIGKAIGTIITRGG